VVKISYGFVPVLRCIVSFKMVKEQVHAIRATAIPFFSINAQTVVTFPLRVTHTYYICAK